MNELLEQLINSKEYKTIAKYKQILDLLVGCADEQGISRISQPEIARRLGLSQSAIAYKFKFLMKFNLIEKIGEKCAYKVISTDLLGKTPIGLIDPIIRLIKAHPEVSDSFAKQAEMLGVTLNEIQTA